MSWGQIHFKDEKQSVMILDLTSKGSLLISISEINNRESSRGIYLDKGQVEDLRKFLQCEKEKEFQTRDC